MAEPPLEAAPEYVAESGLKPQQRIERAIKQLPSSEYYPAASRDITLGAGDSFSVLEQKYLGSYTTSSPRPT